MTTNDRHIIFAPNIRGGGGLVLLRALLQAAEAGSGARAFLDARSAPLLPPLRRVRVSWVNPGLTGRLQAERALSKAAHDGDRTLCFSGVPPLLRPHGKVIVYAQNALTISGYSLKGFSFRTAARLLAERGLHRLFSRNVDEYVVQTPTMRQFVTIAMSNMPVQVVPFLAPSAPETGAEIDQIAEPATFIYPAHDDPHKNHANLLKAWVLLANEEIYPVLELTLEDGNNQLSEQIETCRARGGRVRCLGAMSHAATMAAYRSATAIVYPSFTESFGLPLLEAQQVRRPIVASELDYVRDVCDPIETFDPHSPVSIARSIKRVLKVADRKTRPYAPDEAWAKIMSAS